MISFFEDWILLSENEGTTWNILDIKGNLVKENLEYAKITPFKEGVAIVKGDNERYGAINSFGELVVPCAYHTLSWSYDGLIAAQKDNKWGYINHKNETVIPFEYDSAMHFSDSLAYVNHTSSKGYFIDKQNRVVFSIKREMMLGKLVLRLVFLIVLIIVIIYNLLF